MRDSTLLVALALVSQVSVSAASAASVGRHPVRRVLTSRRNRALLALDTEDVALRADIAALRDETTLLRSQLRDIEEINELAKPRRPPPRISAPRVEPATPASANEPATVATVKLPFGLRIETQVQRTPDGKVPKDEEMSLMRVDLETTKLPAFGRILAVLPYIVPLLDGASFAPAHEPWIPLMQVAQLYYSIPFGTLGFFIALSVLSQNFDLPFALRFNMRQAIMLDITISLPSLLSSLFAFLTQSSGFPQELNTLVFYIALTSVVYCAGANLIGVLPKGIPFISEAADKQAGPR
jgi:hypothetical protein